MKNPIDNNYKRHYSFARRSMIKSVDSSVKAESIMTIVPTSFLTDIEHKY